MDHRLLCEPCHRRVAPDQREQICLGWHPVASKCAMCGDPAGENAQWVLADDLVQQLHESIRAYDLVEKHRDEAAELLVESVGMLTEWCEDYPEEREVDGGACMHVPTCMMCGEMMPTLGHPGGKHADGCDLEALLSKIRAALPRLSGGKYDEQGREVRP